MGYVDGGDPARTVLRYGKDLEMPLTVRQFPCLSDNYGFLARDEASGKTACIDTPDAAAILRELDVLGWSLDLILNTHWHPDHAGGNGEIVFKPLNYVDVELRIPNVGKAREQLGFEAQIELDEGLERTIAWYKARKPAHV